MMQTLPRAQMRPVECSAQEYSSHECAKKAKKKGEFYGGRVQ